MIVRFTSTYDSCHSHDCMIVRFTSTYCGCRGHDCNIVRFTSTYDLCHGHDCITEGKDLLLPMVAVMVMSV